MGVAERNAGWDEHRRDTHFHLGGGDHDEGEAKPTLVAPSDGDDNEWGHRSWENTRQQQPAWQRLKVAIVVIVMPSHQRLQRPRWQRQDKRVHIATLSAQCSSGTTKSLRASLRLRVH